MKISLKWKLITPVLLANVFVMFLMYMVISNIISGINEQRISEETERYALELNNLKEAIQQRNLTSAMLFSKMPVVQQAYKQALQGNINDPDDPTVQAAREYLRSELEFLKQSFDSYGNQEPYLLHFHLPNSRSFYRIWRKKQTLDGRDVSDDLSSFRFMVNQINQTDTDSLNGVELGRGGLIIRGIVKIRDENGKHLGSLEVYTRFTELFEILKTSETSDFSLLMHKEFLPITKRLQDSERFPIVHDQYVVVAQTHQLQAIKHPPQAVLEMSSDNTIIHKRSGSDLFHIFPVHDYRGKQVAKVVVQRDISNLVAFERNVNWVILSTTLGATMLVSLILFVIARALIAPIKRIKEGLNAIGNKRLNYLLHPNDHRRGDEVGEIARNYQASMQNISEVILHLVNNANRIHDVSSTIEQSTNSIHEQSTQISADTNSVANSMDSVNIKTKSVASAAEELSANMKGLSESNQTISKDINAVANTMEAFKSALQQIKQSAQQVLTISNQAQNQAETGRSTLNLLGESTESIAGLVSQIQSISSQTKMLALNATIESASAGEAGKGFAVVANEVKNLSQETSSFSNEISSEIKQMQDKLKMVVSQNLAVHEVIQKINQSNQIVDESIEHQSHEFNQLATTLESLSEAADSVHKNLQEAVIAIRDLAESNANLSVAVETVDNKMQAVMVRISNSEKELSKIQQRCLNLSELAQNLLLVSNQFETGS